MTLGVREGGAQETDGIGLVDGESQQEHLLPGHPAWRAMGNGRTAGIPAHGSGPTAQPSQDDVPVALS